MPPETVTVHAFVCKGIAGALPDQYGVHVTGAAANSPNPLPYRVADGLYSHWTLSTEAHHDFPAVLMHIYFEGDLPSDQEREAINRAVQQLTGQVLFGGREESQ